MWLFPILVWLIAGQYDVVFEHDGFSHRHVGVSYALRVSPAVTRLTVYRRPQVAIIAIPTLHIDKPTYRHIDASTYQHINNLTY